MAFIFFFQAEDGIRDSSVTGVQTCALPISTTITAQALDQFGRGMIGVAITFASDNPAVATVDSIQTDPGKGIAKATVSAHNPGAAHITASASDGVTIADSAQATLSVSGPTLPSNDVSLN